MSAVSIVFTIVFGRCIFCLPAVLAIFLVVGSLCDSLSISGALVGLLALSGISLVAITALSLVGRYIALDGVPGSWFACASIGGLFLTLQNDFYLDWIQAAIIAASISQAELLPIVLRIFNTAIYAGAGLGLIFCSFLLLLELPFVLGTRLAGVTTPGIVSAVRPIALFFGIGMALDLILAFLLREWPVPILLAT